MERSSDLGSHVKQLRLVVEAEDYAGAVRFYRDVLGLREEVEIESPGGALVCILDAGWRPGCVWRSRSMMLPRSPASSSTPAAELIAAPVETPWRSLNARLGGPAGLQLTIFEELDLPQVTERAR